MRAVGITVYNCEPDEAELFAELSPRFGAAPTITGTAISKAAAFQASGNRCVSVSHKSAVSGPVLSALKETGVEYLATRSIGLDHIDLRAAEQLGITVGNAVYSPDGVADYTLMLMLMILRNAKEIVSAAERRDFRLRDVRGRDLRDMTVGIVGAGRIGRAVIRRLQGFGCRVLVHDDNAGTSVAGAAQASLDGLLAESDIVSLHLPLTAGTHHLLGAAQIEAMKRGAFLINTGRGALVDTNALTLALESGRLGGAALDVIEGEEGLFYHDCTKRQIDNQLLLRLQALPNVLITPHTAYYTRQALYDTVEQTIRNCVRFERGRASA